MEKHLALDEFLANYKNKDLIKAKVIIDCLEEIDITERNRILSELANMDDDFAIPILAYLSHKHPTLVAETPQLKGLLLEKSAANPGRIVKCLVDISPETIVLVGLVEKEKIREALPHLRQFLTQNIEIDLQLAILKTLGDLKDENAVASLAEVIPGSIESIQNEAVISLGKIGTGKALEELSNIFGTSSKLDEKIFDILTNLDTEQSFDYLPKSLESPNAETRILGKSKLSRLGSKAIPSLTKALQKNNPDLQIHVLNVLLEIADESSVKAIRQLLNTEPENANVRFAAFEALAHLPSLKGDYLLATGLTDKDDTIRLAAAKAIEKNLDQKLITGIKNMVQSQDAEAVRIIKAIVDAEAAELLLSLLDLPFFNRISTEYIALKVHQSIRDFFITYLSDKGKSELADRIKQMSLTRQDTATRPFICAVDDSTVILSVYRRVINELGFEPVLFEKPEVSLFWLSENKPRVVFTDLNMPKITGIELSKKIREQYSLSDLPIVMVTTQEEGKDKNELTAAGINRIISKPFDTDTIKAVLAELSISL